MVELSKSRLNVSVSSSTSSSPFSRAAAIRLCPLSPEVVGAMASTISSSRMRRVGTWMNNVRLFQILIPTPSACAVARYSPVSENARAVQGLSVLKALMRWPVGRSHTRMTESIDAAMIQRPSLEKQKSLIWAMEPQSSRASFFVSLSTTRIDRSSQQRPMSSLGR